MDNSFVYFMNVVKTLAQSNGFYGRILKKINNLSSDELQQMKNYINAQTFNEPIDVIMFLEA